MHPRTTFLLLLLAVLLGAVILGVERYFPSTREMLEMRRGPIKFDPKVVNRVEIESAGGDGLSFEVLDHRWRVLQPFEDLAEPERLTKMLDEIPAIGWIQRIHPGEFDGDGWTKTALEQPRHRLRFYHKEHLLLELAVGTAAPIEGACYLSVQQPGRTEGVAHYVARTPLPDLLKVQPEDWRDAKLLRLSAAKVASVKLGQNGGQIEISRPTDQHPWALTKPLKARVNKESMDGLLSTLLNLEITEVREAAAQPSPALEEAASLKITISAVADEEKRETFELNLQKPAPGANTTQATCGHRKARFTVRSDSLSTLWAQPNDLRDKMLARINGDRVSRIHIQSLAFPDIQLEKDADSWFLQRHGQRVPANGERVLSFFEAVNTHAILDFTADSAANLGLYGLDKPFLKVGWTESGTPRQLLFGRNSEGTEFYAKHDAEPSIYRIEASLLPDIPQEGIKWKGLGALRFSQFALRRISISVGAAPPTILDYDTSTAQWSGQRAGRDITPLIDRVKADSLAGKLAKFTVQDWSADATNAIQPLLEPAVQIRITLGEPGTMTGPTKDTLLKFAPTQEGMDTALYFGQVDAGPDVFYISRSTLLDLLSPVLKAE